MDIVWFSEIKWDYLKTRKHQIIHRKPPGVRLLFLEPFVKGRRNLFRVRPEGDIHCATVPFVKSAPTFPWRTVLDQRIARRIVDIVARGRIRRLFSQMAFEPARVGYVISNIYAADIATTLPRRFLLYDCNDDHSSFPGMRAWTEAYFYKTSRNADAVFVSAQALRDKVVDARGGQGGVEYLGNGVDHRHFESAYRPPTVTDRPRLGYVGALAPWIDFDAIRDVAARHPEWEVVLVGPILLGVESEVARVTALPNVFHLAAVDYGHVPDVLAQFNVGLIPFRYNELTRGVNPNKLYEYLAAGRPVVSTAFSVEVQRHPDLVRAVDAGDDFVAACEAAVADVSSEPQASALAGRARQVAANNDWDVIADRFWARVSALMNGSAGAPKGERI